MAETSEARKRRAEAAARLQVEQGRPSPASLAAARQQHRREVTQQALAEVYHGADFTDADALLDHLADRGFEVGPR